jgi:alanine racemase
MGQFEYEVARLTVRLGAVAENFRICRGYVGAAAVAGVVKADGYGCGAPVIARTLLAQGCDTFFVARLEEGLALRPVAPRARIFVLDGARETALPALIGHNLTPVLNSLDEIALWSQNAHGRDAAVHIDTGINRLGLTPAEMSVLAAQAGQRLSGINLVLAISHLACAADRHDRLNAEQLGRFKAALAQLPPTPASFASSAGLLLGKDYVFDMVRPGLALYGGNPQNGLPNPFAVAARLTGRILQLRRVDKGESVGYGATFRVERPMVLATVALGYADGLMRVLSNRGMGAIAGRQVPIVGRVSMDLVTLDVTAIPEEHAAVGAEVEFFGDTILLEDMASAAQTASYEILASLGARIPRFYTDEGAP